MAYLIDANSETITLGTAAIPTTGSLAMWVYPLFNAATDTTDRMFLVLVSAPNYFYCDKTSGKAMEFGWYTNAEYRAVAAAGTYTLNQNVWNSIICTWNDSSNETYLYLNSNQIASKTDALVTWDTTGITRYLGTRNDGQLFFNGRFAEVLIWPRVITSGERARFDAGLLPVGGVVGNDWWPLIGNAINAWGGTNGTVTNATVVAHPTTIIHQAAVMQHRQRIMRAA